MKDARITIYENMEDVAPFNFTSNQKPYILEAMQRYSDHCLYEKSKVNGDSSENKQELHKQSVINWVACSARLPDGALGSYFACLKNNTIHKLQYSDMTNKWWDIAMGDIKEQNPVKYWAELPKPPCL